MKNFPNVFNAFKHARMVISTIFFASISVLTFLMLPAVTDGLTFLAIGWLVFIFALIGFFGGLVNFFVALFVKSKIKFLYIILNLAILAVNAYFFYSVLQIIN